MEMHINWAKTRTLSLAKILDCVNLIAAAISETIID
jgi:hypothetical protein